MQHAYAYLWGSFSFDEYLYRDPVLHQWIQRLGDILFRRKGTPSLAELRRHNLSQDEQERLEKDGDESL